MEEQKRNRAASARTSFVERLDWGVGWCVQETEECFPCDPGVRGEVVLNRWLLFEHLDCRIGKIGAVGTCEVKICHVEVEVTWFFGLDRQVQVEAVVVYFDLD